MIVICNWWHILLVFFSVTEWSCESSWNITFVKDGWLEYTARGRAPALSLVVSLRTILCSTGGYLSTNSFIGQEIPSDVSLTAARGIKAFKKGVVYHGKKCISGLKSALFVPRARVRIGQRVTLTWRSLSLCDLTQKSTEVDSWRVSVWASKMPKRSPAKIDYRDCKKTGRRCLLISQQCKWRFGKISVSLFRYDTSSDSAIGKQLKLPVHIILNQSELNHIWDQYGRCLYACTIDDKLVVKRISVVFCRSAFALPSQHRDTQQLSLLRTRTQLWWEVLSLVKNWRQKHILKIARTVRFDQLWYVQAALLWLQCMRSCKNADCRLCRPRRLCRLGIFLKLTYYLSVSFILVFWRCVYIYFFTFCYAYRFLEARYGSVEGGTWFQAFIVKFL